MRLLAAILGLLLGLTAQTSALELPVLHKGRPVEAPINSETWQTRLEALFLEGVLFDEAKRPRGVNKWLRPIEITIRGDAAKDFAPFVGNVASELSKLIDLPMNLLVDRHWAGNIDIFITYRENYWPDFFQAVDPSVTIFTCAATPWSVKGRFKRSRIKINAGVIDTDTAKACLVEELVQSLGLLGEVVAETDTILNDDIGYLGIGPLDKLILAVLYDPRLIAGTPNDKAMVIAKAVIAERLAALPAK